MACYVLARPRGDVKQDGIRRVVRKMRSLARRCGELDETRPGCVVDQKATP